MTFSNPSPLANPLNQHNFQKQSFAINRGSGNPKDLQVPNQDVPLYGSEEWNARYAQQKRLTVPNQDIPLGDQLQGNGFLPGRDDLFRLADGTILNFKTGRIVREVNNGNSQYWGNPDKTISMKASSWNDTPQTSIDELIAKIDDYNGISQQNTLADMQNQLDPESISYWLKAEEEAEKMKANLTQGQLDAIAQFERHFPKSRLIEESKKMNYSSSGSGSGSGMSDVSM